MGRGNASCRRSSAKRDIDRSVRRLLEKNMTFDEWWDKTGTTATPDTYKGWEESCRQAWEAGQKVIATVDGEKDEK